MIFELNNNPGSWEANLTNNFSDKMFHELPWCTLNDYGCLWGTWKEPRKAIWGTLQV